MPNTRKRKKSITADEIAELGENGKDVTKYFKKGKMNPPIENIQIDQTIQRVNVDFAKPMLKELDTISNELNVSRQSLIKTWLRDSMDKYHQNKKYRKAT